MNKPPAAFADVESCVESTLSHIGRRIRLGTPLGLGKANHLVNEFFRRAKEDPRIDLRIFTALTLAKPRWKSDLERRFVEPLAERLFGGYPELAYVEPLHRGTLPDNIRVTEFFFQPGSFLQSPLAQQQYVSSNYTHAVRDILDTGIMGSAKAALESLVRYFAVACAKRGITVNAVSPGWTEDSVLNTLPEQAQKLIRDWHVGGWTPMRRLGTPEDAGNVVALLCSDRAGWITGQVIYADGGASLMNPEIPTEIQIG